MFARKVAVRLKPNALRQFANLMERDIVPWLRKQEGFLDLIVLAGPGGGEVTTLSFWDHEVNTQSYSGRGYPEALRVLEELLDGVPYVKTFEVVSSTFEKAASERPAEEETGPAELGRSCEASA